MFSHEQALIVVSVVGLALFLPIMFAGRKEQVRPDEFNGQAFDLLRTHLPHATVNQNADGSLELQTPYGDVSYIRDGKRESIDARIPYSGAKDLVLTFAEGRPEAYCFNDDVEEPASELSANDFALAMGLRAAVLERIAQHKAAVRLEAFLPA